MKSEEKNVEKLVALKSEWKNSHELHKLHWYFKFQGRPFSSFFEFLLLPIPPLTTTLQTFLLHKTPFDHKFTQFFLQIRNSSLLNDHAEHENSLTTLFVSWRTSFLITIFMCFYVFFSCISDFEIIMFFFRCFLTTKLLNTTWLFSRDLSSRNVSNIRIYGWKISLMQDFWKGIKKVRKVWLLSVILGLILSFFELIFSSFYHYVVFEKKFLLKFSIRNSSFRFF